MPFMPIMSTHGLLQGGTCRASYVPFSGLFLNMHVHKPTVSIRDSPTLHFRMERLRTSWTFLAISTLSWCFAVEHPLSQIVPSIKPLVPGLLCNMYVKIHTKRYRGRQAQEELGHVFPHPPVWFVGMQSQSCRSWPCLVYTITLPWKLCNLKQPTVRARGA